MALKIAKITGNHANIPHEQRGNRAFELGDLDGAVTHFLSALEQDDENAGLYLKLGAVFLQLGKVDKAIIALKRGLELAPYEADAYNAMGHALFQLDFFGAAEAFFARALALDARHATAKANLIEARKAGRNGDAVMPPEFDSVMALLALKEPSISLCMIAKNEEQFIGDCLASVHGLVDEIIVVDTGSTDRTVEIAESFGAKVYHYPWTGDFAAARNESLSHATSDWILVLDADETLPAEGHAELKKALRNKDNVGYALAIENLMGDAGNEVQTALIFRLFQNRPDVRFEGIIHEQAMLSAQRTGMPIYNLTTRIIHRGYLNQYVTERNKYQRNLDILLRQVEEEPDHPYAYFNLGQTYKLMERYAESEQSYKKCLRLLDEKQESHTTPYWLAAFFSLADLYRMVGQPEEGLKIAEKGLKQYPDSADLLYTYGLILLVLERYEAAIKAFQACRSYKGVIHAAGNDPSVPTYKSSQALGTAYSRMGQHALAKRHYLQAIQEWEYPNSELFTNLGIVHLQLEEHQEALQYFIKAVERDEKNARAWSNIGFICQQLGQDQEALAAQLKAYEIDARENGFAYGKALLHVKRFQEAERVMAQQTEVNVAHAPGWIYLGLIKLCLGKRDEAMETWQELEQRSEFDPKSREDASSLLTFAHLLGNEDEASPLTRSFRSRDGELWVLIVTHLILAERYSEVERALKALGSFSIPGMDMLMGRMLGKHGLHEEAMAFLLKARELAPDSSEIYVMLGEAAEGLKNAEDAMVMYQMALSLDPKQVSIRQRMGRLRLMGTAK